MKQAVMVKPGIIEYRDVPEPGRLSEYEVLLRIKKIGICGSDIHVYHGLHPATPYPVIQGHEYSARVEAIGRKVTRIKPGMKVTARPQLVCGKCGPCRKGQYNACTYLKVEGFQAPGAAQELFIVTEDRVAILPEHLTLEEGAMVEPSAVGAHATGRSRNLAGNNVVVSGAGTIGNLVAQFAKVRGAKKVLITDLSDFRLNLAEKCGIDGILNVSKTSFEEGIKNYFGDEGFQVGFEAAGNQSSLDVLMQFIEKGGEIILIGVYSKDPVVNMYFLGEHELDVYGSMMYRHDDYECAIDMIANRKINALPLHTCSFPFEKFHEAYEFIENQGDHTLKVMIDL